MSPYKKIKAIDKALKDNVTAENKHAREKFKLQRDRTKAFLDYAMKGGLKTIPWNVTFNEDIIYGGFQVTLYSVYSSFPKLADTAEEYMAATELTKGVVIYNRDGGFEIAFQTPAKAKSFIDKHGLQVNFTNIKDTYNNIIQEKQKIDSFLTAYGVNIEQI